MRFRNFRLFRETWRVIRFVHTNNYGVIEHEYRLAFEVSTRLQIHFAHEVRGVAESSQSPSTRYFFRVVTVFVVVATVTSTTVVPNPSSLISMDWWGQVQRCWSPGFPSYGGRGPDPGVRAEASTGTDWDPASNFTGINFQILQSSKSQLSLSCIYVTDISVPT